MFILLKTNYKDIFGALVSRKISQHLRSLTPSCQGCENQLKVPPVSAASACAAGNWKPLSAAAGPHLQLMFHTDAPKDSK